MEKILDLGKLPVDPKSLTEIEKFVKDNRPELGAFQISFYSHIWKELKTVTNEGYPWAETMDTIAEHAFKMAEEHPTDVFIEDAEYENNDRPLVKQCPDCYTLYNPSESCSFCNAGNSKFQPGRITNVQEIITDPSYPVKSRFLNLVYLTNGENAFLHQTTGKDIREAAKEGGGDGMSVMISIATKVVTVRGQLITAEYMLELNGTDFMSIINAIAATNNFS